MFVSTLLTANYIRCIDTVQNEIQCVESEKTKQQRVECKQKNVIELRIDLPGNWIYVESLFLVFIQCFVVFI